MVRRALAVLTLAGVSGCTDPPAPSPEPPTPRLAEPVASAAPVRDETGCPADMVLVSGLFCPVAEERCKAHDPEYEGDPEKSERCLEFAEPSRCVSKDRTLLRFCIDRYEWPNRAGELPRVLVDFTQAKASCESVGKRLCDEHEWLFACEGEAMLPYVNGYERDATACSIDRPYLRRPHVLSRWDECMATPECRRDFAHVDQREPSGAFERCVSPFGAYDMNGNVNEWVNLPDADYPHRSGLKGGWWGPVRDRCRPTVRFHDESDWGYEIGFRCCKPAAP
ncbi:MAG TPA: SUMF1/EgtB/PvdO family nonheme iron enzyme [Polyangiaceae bacterium]|nr:SUMF1/EgtB/PvdO family nonheme iron enzyme [Polyangiaceae bacterium]